MYKKLKQRGGERAPNSKEDDKSIIESKNHKKGEIKC